MPRNTFVTKDAVTLEGYQAVMKPSKYGYSCSATVDQSLVDQLEEDREETLKWAVSKLKNPKRSTLKPEPWEEVADGVYKVKFSWNEETSHLLLIPKATITDVNLPIYSGSKVKLAFYQKALYPQGRSYVWH